MARPLVSLGPYVGLGDIVSVRVLLLSRAFLGPFKAAASLVSPSFPPSPLPPSLGIKVT